MKMQLSTSAFLCVLYIACSPCEGASGDAFTMINKVQTMCEVESMSLASKLSDNYNSLDEAAEKEDRMKHEFVAAHIGFGWDHALGTKVRADDRVSELQKSGGWVDDSATSAYHAAHNKWIYFYGDITIRPIASTFLLPSHAKEMHSSKEWANSKCSSQESHRTIAVTPAPVEGAGAVETHTGKHTAKARTCHFPGFGSDGRITYDWKHLPFDEYDQWLFGKEGPWTASSSTEKSSSERHPDVLVIEVGHSVCTHPTDPAAEPNLDKDKLIEHLTSLFDGVQGAILRPAVSVEPAQRTTVILSTAPRVTGANHATDRCVYKLNRILAREAHRHGFVVLEREEIEHRLMFKQEASEDLKELIPMPEPPTHHVLATSLLSMISCLARNGTGQVTA